MSLPPTRQRFKEEKEFNIKIFRTPVFGHHGLHKFEYLLFYRKAIGLVKKNKIDLIHAQNGVLPRVIGHLIKRKLNIPLLLSIECINKTCVYAALSEKKGEYYVIGSGEGRSFKEVLEKLQRVVKDRLGFEIEKIPTPEMIEKTVEFYKKII